MKKTRKNVLNKKIKETHTQISIKWMSVFGHSAQKMLRFPKKEVEELYQIGWDFLKNEKKQEAVYVFLFLLTLNPYRGEYWTAFALLAYQMGEIELGGFALKMADLFGAEREIEILLKAKKLFETRDRKNYLKACLLLQELENEKNGEMLKEDVLLMLKLQIC